MKRHIEATLALTALLALGISSPLPATAAAQTIYSDSLQNGWQPWGWATLNYNNTAPVHTGHKSVAVTVKKGWDALYIHHAAFDASPYSSFTFWVNGGPKGGQALQVYALVKGKSVKSYRLPPVKANTWTRISVPLAALGVAHRKGIDGFWIQDAAGKPLPTFYVDDISLR